MGSILFLWSRHGLSERDPWIVLTGLVKLFIMMMQVGVHLLDVYVIYTLRCTCARPLRLTPIISYITYCIMDIGNNTCARCVQ